MFESPNTHEKINYTVPAQLDTGAECNLISKNWLKKYPQLLKKIKPCTINLQGPTNQPIQCEGCIALNISCGGQVKKKILWLHNKIVSYY